MQKNRNENEKAKGCADLESARNRNTIDERVEQETSERRHAHRLADLMHFLAKMKVRHEGVLREMHEKKSDEDQRSSAGSILFYRFRSEIENRNRQHEARR